MDVVALILSVVIILSCFYFIISPFFTFKGELADIKEEKQELLSLESIYEAVNELEMDYLMKKITEEDFNKLKEQHQLLAVEIMEMEKNQKVRKSNSIDKKEIELEILNDLHNIRMKKGR